MPQTHKNLVKDKDIHPLPLSVYINTQLITNSKL